MTKRPMLLLIVVAATRVAVAETSIEEAAEEIERLARTYDGSASPEARETARRLRQILSRVTSAAVAGGAEARAAGKLLDETLARPQARVAMEAVMALLSARSQQCSERVCKALPSMALAVRRRTLDRLRAGGVDVRKVEGHLLSVLEVEKDAQAKTAVVVLLGRLGTLESARSLVAAAPPLPPLERGRFRGIEWIPARVEGDRWSGVREALVEALSKYRRPEVLEWAGGGDAFASPPGGLWVVCRWTAARKLEASRPHLENLLGGDPRLALEALGSIEALGAARSADKLEAVARSDETAPAVAVAAAALLARAAVDPAVPAVGLPLLLELTTRERWRLRSRAVWALGAFPREDRAFETVSALLDRDPHLNVRRAAYGALKRFRREETIDLMIERLAPLRGKDPRWALEYLRWASGRRLGKDVDAWKHWWHDAKEDYRFPPPATGER